MQLHKPISPWASPATSLAPFVEMVEDAMAEVSRSAPFDLIRFPDDSAGRFLDAEGHITIAHDALDWVRLGS